MVVLKKKPEDFVVEEIPPLFLVEKEDAQGGFSVFKLWKKNFTTHEALKRTSTKLGTSLSSVGFAGNKDKRAVTTQYISVEGDYEEREFSERHLKIRFVGHSNRPVSLGTHRGNKFRITAREVESSAEKREGYINYFDKQRFSENNVSIGRALVKKNYSEVIEKLISSNQDCSSLLKSHLSKTPNDYVGALQRVPKKKLVFFVHAYQSMLFNEALSLFIRKNLPSTAKDYSFSRLSFPWKFKKLRSAEFPLPGFTKYDGRYKELLKEVMQEEEITHKDFVNRQISYLSAEGDLRNALIDISRLELSSLKDGVQRTSFTLGKGSYATMVLKQLFL